MREYNKNTMTIIFDKKGTPSLEIVKNGYLASYTHKLYAGYIEEDRVHDFNGNQRGWFDNGLLRDLSGKCVGFTSKANGKLHPKFPSITLPKKTIKLSEPPLKPVSQEYPCERPAPQKIWANKNPTTLMIP